MRAPGVGYGWAGTGQGLVGGRRRLGGELGGEGTKSGAGF